ncbi:MAG: polysaccharide biosynthesis/export family protein [Methyloceanibacter sp.]
MTYPTYRLYSGDRVGIIVFGQDNLSRLYSVDTAGRIAFPLIGTVEARGLSTTQLASEIEGKLKKNYIKDPKVTVEVDAYRPFFILGEVTKPRQYPYVNGMTSRARSPSPRAMPSAPLSAWCGGRGDSMG